MSLQLICDEQGVPVAFECPLEREGESVELSFDSLTEVHCKGNRVRVKTAASGYMLACEAEEFKLARQAWRNREAVEVVK